MQQIAWIRADAIHRISCVRILAFMQRINLNLPIKVKIPRRDKVTPSVTTGGILHPFPCRSSILALNPCASVYFSFQEQFQLFHDLWNFVPRVFARIETILLMSTPTGCDSHFHMGSLYVCIKYVCKPTPPRPTPPIPLHHPNPPPYNLYVCPRLVILMFWRGSFLKVYACMHNDNFCK